MHRRLDSLPANAVQLVDEDDAGGVGLCLLCKAKEEVIQPCWFVSPSIKRVLIYSTNLLKRFLMRLAPTPTNISSNSDPEA